MSNQFLVANGDDSTITFEIPDDAQSEFEGFVCVECPANRKRDFHMNALQAAEHINMHVFNGETVPVPHVKWFIRLQTGWRARCAKQNKALKEQAAKDANKVYAS